MKRIFFILFVILKCNGIIAQPFVINGAWKVSWEDKKEFSNIAFDDAGWQELQDLQWNDSRNTTANRTLWVRKKITIPSTLKAAFDKTGLLALSMGKISQSDDTYFNGKLLGSTGSGDTYRNYLLKPTDIFWDKENTISIRVRHWGSFKISKVPEIVTASPEHFLSFKAGLKNGDVKATVAKKALTYQLTVTNRSPKGAVGVIKAIFYNFAGSKMYSAKQNVNLASGENAVDFVFTSPSSFLKIVYFLSVPLYKYHTEWNSETGYQDVAYKKVSPLIADKVLQKYIAADLDKIKIEGWLGERLQANTQMRLKKVDEDAILAGYINRPGSHSWIGEHVGKFLDAACDAYENNHDAALKIQIDRSAQQLIASQLPDGYLGTYEPDGHWTSWDVWSHKYCIIGLLKYYKISGFKPALEASEKAANLLCKTFGYSKGQLDIINAGSHVGMAATSVLEPMVDLYTFTGNKKYLDFCYYLIKAYDQDNGPKIITTLDATGGRTDKTANAKAYEMLSNLVGIIKLYKVTGDRVFFKPVQLAWNDIVKNRLYITGTASSFEHFQDDNNLPATENDNMGEGCVTTTWIQLTYQMLTITGEIKYVDELERAVYNHLAGAENPGTGCVSYYTPLVGIKPYRCVITCCMSSVPRGIAMIPLFANGKIDNKPAFLFYQPGTYATSVGKNVPVSFTTITNFPVDGEVAITVDEGAAAAYAIEFRKPYWAARFSLSVNGKKQLVDSSGSITISRIWAKGDMVAISFTMPLMVLDGGKTYPGKVAFQRGPQVLAFDKSLNDVAADEVAVDAKNAVLQTTDAPSGKWIGGEAFQIKGSANNAVKNITMVPYADASQTGGAITTWIKNAVIN